MPAHLLRWIRTLGLAALTLVGCVGCSTLGHGFLSPQGPVSSDQRYLFFLTLAITLIVVLPVLVLTPWLVWRYRRRATKSAYRPKWEFSWPMEILAWGVPVAVVIALAVFVWNGAHRLDPYRPIASKQKPLQVQVVGLDWKWLFIYPAQHVASVNQLAIPAGRPVHLVLTSDSVMQSLLIPRLVGQIYAMAGMRTQLYLKANHPGRFRGENTQYNGMGFQAQKFRTLALPEQQFKQWVSRARGSGNPLDCGAYRQLEKKSVVAHPRFFDRVQPHLFHWVLAKYTEHPTPRCTAAGNETSHD